MPRHRPDDGGVTGTTERSDVVVVIRFRLSVAKSGSSLGRLLRRSVNRGSRPTTRMRAKPARPSSIDAGFPGTLSWSSSPTGLTRVVLVPLVIRMAKDWCFHRETATRMERVVEQCPYSDHRYFQEKSKDCWPHPPLPCLRKSHRQSRHQEHDEQFKPQLKKCSSRTVMNLQGRLLDVPPRVRIPIIYLGRPRLTSDRGTLAA